MYASILMNNTHVAWKMDHIIRKIMWSYERKTYAFHSFIDELWMLSFLSKNSPFEFQIVFYNASSLLWFSAFGTNPLTSVLRHFQDDYVVAPYAINGGKWLGYDDEESVRIKSQYILDQGYGGGMVWSIDTDDFHGFCTGKKFGLIATIKEVLRGSQPQPTMPTVVPTKPSAEPPKTTTQSKFETLYPHKSFC